jgi:YbbR domain-containing protein
MKRIRLFDDLLWKLGSVALAFALWLLFSGSQELTTVVSAPIQYRNISPRLDISSEMVESAHLHLRGPSTQLSRIRSEALPLVIDLSQVKSPGERTYSLDAAGIRLPAAVQLERVVPSQVRLRFEVRASREVPVEVRTVNLPAGWKIASQTCSPQRLNVLGPESRVARMKAVETDAIDLSQPSTDPITANVTAFAGDSQISFAGPPTVQVRIQLQRQ